MIINHFCNIIAFYKIFKKYQLKQEIDNEELNKNKTIFQGSEDYADRRRRIKNALVVIRKTINQYIFGIHTCR